jgi:uncharacterized protein YbdZ (MbtH family)
MNKLLSQTQKIIYRQDYMLYTEQYKYSVWKPHIKKPKSWLLKEQNQ